MFYLGVVVVGSRQSDDLFKIPQQNISNQGNNSCFKNACNRKHWVFTRSFHSAQELNFFQVFFLANPVPWDVNNKTMSFFSHKNCFFGSQSRDMVIKIIGEQKKVFDSLSHWGPKDLP